MKYLVLGTRQKDSRHEKVSYGPPWEAFGISGTRLIKRGEFGEYTSYMAGARVGEPPYYEITLDTNKKNGIVLQELKRDDDGYKWGKINKWVVKRAIFNCTGENKAGGIVTKKEIIEKLKDFK
ncbi:MAG: hypothetical protein JSV39_02105 [Candidatus Aenigmatarchaeota archaeon]|nr:MAG: hypothetical protein JSV39_02105 [Candidatus Aenigmarchaeota archaeon]